MNVFDVAEYILREHGGMTSMKLQKLVYYSHCWSLVLDERPLHESRIEAWANGPVCPELFDAHRGRFVLEAGAFKDSGGDPDALDGDARETVDAVLNRYGDKEPEWLSTLTHTEAPWMNARNGLPPGVRGNNQIPDSAIIEYYGGLMKDKVSE